MKKTIQLCYCLLICLGMISSGWSHAAEPVLREKLLNALVSGDDGYLEKTLNGVQQDFEHNRQNNTALSDTYYSFNYLQREMDAALASRRLNDWVTHYPNSYAAKTVRGMFLSDKAFQARGNKFAADTTDAQFTEMRKWYTLAKRDLLTSLKLTPYPLISRIRLYNIAMVESDDRAKQTHFLAAYKMAPTSMQLHREVLISLTPRWGGSYEAMQAYINKISPGLDSNKNKNVLQSMIIEDKASNLIAKKQYEEAYTLYNEAIELRDSSNYLCKRAYLGSLLKKPALSILSDLKIAATKNVPDPYCATMAAHFARSNISLPDAVPLLDSYITYFPRNADLYNAKGWVYQEKGDKVSAFPALMKSAELGDAWGQTMAGKYLFSGWGGTTDRVKALTLLKAAAEQGEPNAQLSVVQALDILERPEEARLAEQHYATMNKR